MMVFPCPYRKWPVFCVLWQRVTCVLCVLTKHNPCLKECNPFSMICPYKCDLCFVYPYRMWPVPMACAVRCCPLTVRERPASLRPTVWPTAHWRCASCSATTALRKMKGDATSVNAATRVRCVELFWSHTREKEKKRLNSVLMFISAWL